MIDQPMDETTLEALSLIVCGDEEGKGHEIAPFFRKCGLRLYPETPTYINQAYLAVDQNSEGPES